MASTTINSMFRNPFYYSLFRWKGKLEQGNHKPMITKNEFEKAQSILGKTGANRPIKHNHTYNGMIRCGECGQSITTEPVKIKRQKNGNVHTYQYMRCTKKKGSDNCSQKYIQVKNLEEQIDRILDSIEISPAFQDWIFKQIKKENNTENETFQRKRAQLQKQYSENEAMIESLTDNLIKKVIDSETYQTSKQRYESKRRHLKSKIENYEQNKDDWITKIEAVFNFAKEARLSFAEGDRDTKRQIFVALGSNLILKSRKLLLEIKKPFISIQKAVEKERPLLKRFEPVKNDLHKAKSPYYEELITTWGG